MVQPNRTYPMRAALFGVFAALGLATSPPADANPLVGEWEPAMVQSNPEIARGIDQLGRLRITPTHLAAFGESPLPYEYEQHGEVFRVKTTAPNAKPIDFVLRDPNTLLMHLPNGMDIAWQRVATATAPKPAPDAPAASAESASQPDLTFEMLNMMMPHSRPTRYEVMDESLEALLDDGWTITHASGVGPAMGLVLQRGQQHAVCALFGNLQDRQTGRSDCRLIN